MDRRDFLTMSAASLFTTTTSSAVHAAATPVRTQAPGFYRLDLGGTEITALSDGSIPVPLDSLYSNTTPARVRTVLDHAFIGSPADLSVNAYLVNTGDRLVLIDAGTGRFLGPELGLLPAALQSAGYSPDQVDDVILTHVHADHSGGLILDGRPLFGNATVHVNNREIGYWLDRGQRTKAADRDKHHFVEAEACLGPYAAAQRLRGFSDNADPLPGFGSIWLPGHTPGHSAIVVERGTRKLVLWGDVTHGDVVQFGEPSVTIEFDVDPQQAALSRAKAFADAAEHRYWVAGAHIAFPGIGHVRREKDMFGWVAKNFSRRGLL
ncbi:MBL fold metallo-hydrolase [Bosea sp. Tri-44]|uniref:MBL fold metallo-hydrolase n=1 Tax=Bosea sp. Tri-44 TaxID=1972137 RepID=UPI00100EE18B|nr:MBL fold metallo-hydrolase [Bosea sp. Tri-44]RXT51193.1 MBL fold metallo-hydrolase [Bosea sp. Tri-44]